MTEHGWRRRILRILASVAIYWIACLAAVALVYPFAPGATGFVWAPLTYLVIGAAALPMDLSVGYGAEPVVLFLYVAGIACLLAGLLLRRWSWAALPGLCCLGLLGEIAFSGGSV
jgi:hypothetical protein